MSSNLAHVEPPNFGSIVSPLATGSICSQGSCCRIQRHAGRAQQLQAALALLGLDLLLEKHVHAEAPARHCRGLGGRVARPVAATPAMPQVELSVSSGAGAEPRASSTSSASDSQLPEPARRAARSRASHAYAARTLGRAAPTSRSAPRPARARCAPAAAAAPRRAAAAQRRDPLVRANRPAGSASSGSASSPSMPDAASRRSAARSPSRPAPSAASRRPSARGSTSAVHRAQVRPLVGDVAGHGDAWSCWPAATSHGGGARADREQPRLSRVRAGPRRMNQRSASAFGPKVELAEEQHVRRRLGGGARNGYAATSIAVGHDRDVGVCDRPAPELIGVVLATRPASCGCGAPPRARNAPADATAAASRCARPATAVVCASRRCSRNSALCAS